MRIFVGLRIIDENDLHGFEFDQLGGQKNDFVRGCFGSSGSRLGSAGHGTVGKLNNIRCKTVFIQVKTQCAEQDNGADSQDVFRSHGAKWTITEKEYSK
jgi:hypothetical protein